LKNVIWVIDLFSGRRSWAQTAASVRCGCCHPTENNINDPENKLLLMWELAAGIRFIEAIQ
jgi:hypothetical protein